MILVFLSFIVTFIIFINSYSFVNRADLNTICYFFSLPLYINYFKKYRKNVIEVIPFVTSLLIIISFYQQIAVLSGSFELSNIFNNYSYQSNYKFPITSLGFYRTSSLFNESSQYSVFLVLFIVSFYSNFINKTKFTFFLITISIIELVVNESLTAYVLLAIYFIYSVITRLTVFRSIFIFSFVFSLLIINYQVLENIYDKFYYTFYSQDNSYVRLSSALNKINIVSFDSFWLGRGLSWEAISFDLISVYFYGFGFLGLLFVLIFLFFLVYLKFSILSFLFLINLLSNGVLHLSLNIFFVGMILIFRTPKMYKLKKFIHD